jgi:hypothetical protein
LKQVRPSYARSAVSTHFRQPSGACILATAAKEAYAMSKKPEPSTQSTPHRVGGTKPPAEHTADDVPSTETTLDDEAGPDSPVQRPKTPTPLDPAIGRIP